MFGYGFPQELQDAIDAATAKFGPIECAKKFLFYFMETYSAPPHMNSLCQIKEDQVSGIFFLIFYLLV